MMFDFYAKDLLDRVDWSDPDFPAFARMLHAVSHPVTMDNGVENFNAHVVTVYGEPNPKNA